MRVWKQWLLAFAAMPLVPAAHAGNISFHDYLQRAAHCPGVYIKDFSNYTIFICDGGDMYYYITKLNHPASPAVIVRRHITDSDDPFMQMEGHSFGTTDASQQALKTWMNELSE